MARENVGSVVCPFCAAMTPAADNVRPIREAVSKSGKKSLYFYCTPCGGPVFVKGENGQAYLRKFGKMNSQPEPEQQNMQPEKQRAAWEIF